MTEHYIRIDDEGYVPVKTYSRAIDEIYELRALLASEARILEAHGEYKTFPKSRRQELADSIKVMRLATRGEGKGAIHRNQRYRNYRAELRAIGATETLTNQRWESQAFPETSEDKS